MQRIAFTMRIKPGSEEEYRRRHQQVWPEMQAELKRAGCHCYSIYARGLELFAYVKNPSPEGDGLVPSPKAETVGCLTTAHSGQMYHPEQEKQDTSPEC